jgi:hypothetical protein
MVRSMAVAVVLASGSVVMAQGAPSQRYEFETGAVGVNLGSAGTGFNGTVQASGSVVAGPVITGTAALAGKFRPMGSVMSGRITAEGQSLFTTPANPAHGGQAMVDAGGLTISFWLNTDTGPNGVGNNLFLTNGAVDIGTDKKNGGSQIYSRTMAANGNTSGQITWGQNPIAGANQNYGDILPINTWNYWTMVLGAQVTPSIPGPGAFIYKDGVLQSYGDFYLQNVGWYAIPGGFNLGANADTGLRIGNRESNFARPDITLAMDNLQIQAGTLGVSNPWANTSAVDAAALALYEQQFVRPGDANRDRTVSFEDLLVLAQNYNTPSGATWLNGDFTQDGAVNFSDLLALAQNYNSVNGSLESDWLQAQSLVPEPTALTMLGATALLLARRARRS